jgi:UDP-N-acetylglucosamine--dolichyl-phosphate N-acetylglucosaminephosphotransferase
MFATAAACLGFLKFNRLPSRIFPGDVGTFVIGSAIAAAVIAGNMEFVGLVASMPYIINGVITGTGVIRGKPIQKFSKLEAGVLVPPARSHVSSLYFELERAFRLSEGGVVKIVWLIGAVFGALSLTIVFFT